MPKKKDPYFVVKLRDLYGVFGPDGMMCVAHSENTEAMKAAKELNDAWDRKTKEGKDEN
jgi:hypothetical protein